MARTRYCHSYNLDFLDSKILNIKSRLQGLINTAFPNNGTYEMVAKMQVSGATATHGS